MTTTRLLVMITARLYAILFIFLSLTACEKLDTTTPSDADSKGQKSNTSNKSNSNGDEEVVTAYSVDDVINGEIAEAYYKTETSLPGIWVYGYIVGYIDGTSMNAAVFGTGERATNLLLADTPFETDPDKCLPIQLSTSSKANQSVRTALNLSNHPENYRQKVAICGTVTTYMSTIGLKNTTDYQFLDDDFDYDAYNKEHENTEDPNNGSNTENTDPNKTEEPNNNEGGNTNPPSEENDTKIYTVADILGFTPEQNFFLSNKQVKGYIVGYVAQGKKGISHTIFYQVNEDIEFRAKNNIVIADTPNERNYKNCIAVQLPEKSENNVRENLNINNHPENFERIVTVTGDITSYMGVLGVINTRNYSFSE